MANAIASLRAVMPRVEAWAPHARRREPLARPAAPISFEQSTTRGNVDLRSATDLPSPRQNRLIAALPAADRDRLVANLKPVALRQGDVICEPGGPSLGVYFPTTSVISLQCVTQSGESAEVAVVGREGLVGAALCLSDAASPASAVVRAAGYAYRLSVHHLQSELHQGGPLARLLLHHAQALITQSTQIAVCNRHHTIEQQLSRWLLAAADRTSSGFLSVTQDLVAGALGVRREGVTRAAGRLQRDGFIRYRRGHVVVLDRTGLESRSCECYGVIKSALDGLLARCAPADARILLAHAGS